MNFNDMFILVGVLCLTVAVQAGYVKESGSAKKTEKHTKTRPGIDEDPDSTPGDGKTTKSANELKQEISDKKKKAEKTTLDRQLSSIRQDLEDTSDKDAVKREMLNDLREIHHQRMRLRMLIGGYTFAQMILTIGKFVPVLNIYLATGAAGINMVNNWLIEPLDQSYHTHQEAYANAVAHFLEKYPEYRKGYNRLPSHLKVTMEDGEQLDLRVLKQNEKEQLPEKSLHLTDKGPFELANMVMQMK